MKKTKIYAEVLEDSAMEQFKKAMSLDCNVQGALMPDAHTGYTLPIGAVIKSKGKIFPSYVGYDIGCGMCAVKLNVKKENIDFQKLKEYIVKNVPVGTEKYAEKQKYSLKEPFTEVAKKAFESGIYQLGTLGGGNHFIEVGEGKDGYLWIVIHSGSRGFGYKIAEHYMKEAAIVNVNSKVFEREFHEKNKKFWEAVVANKAKEDDYNKALKKYVLVHSKKQLSKSVEEHYGFDLNSEEGQNYLKDMNCALEFALENRKRMIETIILGMKEQFSNIEKIHFINRNHNHAEEKDGFIIHRKGATHAEKGMDGVIPGNMRDGSFIVKGKGNIDSMSSSSHGAGRVLSRKKAKETLSVKEFHKDMVGIVTNHTKDTVDEAPKAYKNIYEVMELQKDLVEVIDQVKPLLNIKG